MKYLLYALFTVIIRILPRAVMVKLAWFFGSLLYFFAGKRRIIVKRNLCALQNYSEKELTQLTKTIFRNFLICFSDFCRFTNLQKEDLPAIISVDNFDKVKNAVSQNNGLIALTAHLGHWELGAIYLELKGLKTHVVYHEYEDKATAAFFNRIRHPRLHWMNAEEGLREPLTILKNGETLATAVDINFFKGGITVPYLNGHKKFPLGPALLSYHTGAPIVLAYAVLDETKKKYTTMADPPIVPNRNASKNDELFRITKLIAKSIERTIKQYPEQWFIFQHFME